MPQSADGETGDVAGGSPVFIRGSGKWRPHGLNKIARTLKQDGRGVVFFEDNKNL